MLLNKDDERREEPNSPKSTKTSASLNNKDYIEGLSDTGTHESTLVNNAEHISSNNSQEESHKLSIPKSKQSKKEINIAEEHSIELQVLGYNARSLRSEEKRRTLEVILHRNIYDVVFIAETWLSQPIIDPSKIYKIYQRDSKNEHGGTLIAVKDKFINFECKNKFKHLTIC